MTDVRLFERFFAQNPTGGAVPLTVTEIREDGLTLEAPERAADLHLYFSKAQAFLVQNMLGL